MDTEKLLGTVITYLAVWLFGAMAIFIIAPRYTNVETFLGRIIQGTLVISFAILSSVAAAYYRKNYDKGKDTKEQ